MTDLETRALRWAASAGTGLSSKAILAVMSGAPRPSRHDFPRDGGDLARCIGLLDAVPEWRQRIHEMAVVGEEWAALAAQWGELERLHHAGKGEEVYALIKKLTRPIRERDPSVVSFGSGELIMPDRKRR